jgi:MinD-like ATPase involved in chromosome partitioning or flagellar assembly
VSALAPALLGGAADRQEDLEAADRAIRAPLALSRRIGFVQLAGGVGASTTVAAVAALVAARRGTPVLAVDAAAGPRSLTWHLGVEPARHIPRDPARLRPRTQEEALAGLPRTATGVAALDVHEADDIAVTEAMWAAQVAPLARFCAVVCTDWGLRGAGADLGGAAAASSVLCIVSRADRTAVERAVSAASSIRHLPHRPDVVVAVVDVGRSGAALPGSFATAADVPLVRVPFEPARRAAGPVPGSACSGATRAALIRLSAAVMAQRRSGR